MVVLVVEDEALVRAFVADLLEEAGFDVIEAPSADYAVLILHRRADVAVVFTDVDMPGQLDGFQLARFVHDEHPKAGVIVGSGFARPAPGNLPPRAIFLPKPYVPAALVQSVQELASISA